MRDLIESTIGSFKENLFWIQPSKTQQGRIIKLLTLFTVYILLRG